MNPTQPANSKPAKVSANALKQPWFYSKDAFNLFMHVGLDIEDHDYVQEAVALAIHSQEILPPDMNK